jgi:pyruvate,water dikinase
MATTGEMVVGASMLRQVLRSEDDAGFLLLLSLIGMRPTETASLAVSSRLPVELPRFVTYEVADRSASFGGSVVRWRGSQARDARGPTARVAPPQLGGAARWLVRFLTTAIEDRENTKMLGLRSLSCVRLLVDNLKSIDPDDASFLGATELVRLMPDEVVAIAGRRRAQLEDAEPLDLPVDFVYTNGPFRSLRPAPEQLLVTGEGRGLTPGFAVAALASADESFSDKILFGRSLGAPEIVAGRPAGVIVEYGSILSHIAIVCRELGIPLVAGVRVEAGASGRRVRIDGWTGAISFETEQATS